MTARFHTRIYTNLTDAIARSEAVRIVPIGKISIAAAFFRRVSSIGRDATRRSGDNIKFIVEDLQ